MCIFASLSQCVQYVYLCVYNYIVIIIQCYLPRWSCWLFIFLRGNCTPNLKFACFVLYLKNYQHLFEKRYIDIMVNCQRNVKIVLNLSRPSGSWRCTVLFFKIWFSVSFEESSLQSYKFKIWAYFRKFQPWKSIWVMRKIRALLWYQNLKKFEKQVQKRDSALKLFILNTLTILIHRL